MRRFYPLIRQFLETNYCKNYKMVQDFSTQFNLLYLHTKIVLNTEHPVYHLGLHRRAHHSFSLRFYRSLFL